MPTPAAGAAASKPFGQATKHADAATMLGCIQETVEASFVPALWLYISGLLGCQGSNASFYVYLITTAGTYSVQPA